MDESEKTSFENLKYSSDLVKLKEQNKKLTISNLATHLSECSELGLLVVNTLDEHTTKETKTPINVVPPFSPPPSLAPHLFPPTLFPRHPFSPLVGFQKEVSCYRCDDKFPHEVVLKDHYEKVHPEIILFWCKVCWTNFGSERGLQSHMRNDHKECL